MTASDGFLGRWSRLKRGAASTTPGAVAPTPAATVPVPAVAGEQAVSAPPPELPSLDALDLSADFSGFLKKEVAEGLRKAALRKLFADPHFNRMDGLDVYIDDYSVSEPIPSAVMKTLQQFRTYLDDADKPAQDDAAPADALPAAAVPAPDCDSLDDVGQNVAQADDSSQTERKIGDSDG